MEELREENLNPNAPDWVQDKKIHEVLFCKAFLDKHPMICINGTFFTKEGRVTDENTNLNRLEQRLRELLSSMNPMNAKRVREEILKILDDYIPGVAELMTKTKALKMAEKELRGEIAMLKKEAHSSKPSVQRLLELEKKVQEQAELQRTIASLQQTLTAIPPEIIAEYTDPKSERKETIALE